MAARTSQPTTLANMRRTKERPAEVWARAWPIRAFVRAQTRLTIRDPGVLAALNPRHALNFLTGHGWIGSFALGSVFLAMTGAQALYADMGHFGRGPIRLDWFALVLPALVLNYFGQGALVLAHPEAAASPFFKLFPDWGLCRSCCLRPPPP
jgi:K+ transporter